MSDIGLSNRLQARAVPNKKSVVALPQLFPDFHSRMRVSGRWILMADIGAMLLAFLGGAVFAWIRTLLSDQVSYDVLRLVSFRQFAIFLSIGMAAILWLDSKGHYRQRLPYWEAIGHLIGVSCCGFVSCGFVEFAAKDDLSRLWIAFCWGLFAGFSFLGRGLVRRVLNKMGVWRIPALIIGEGQTAEAAVQALSGDSHIGFTIVDRMPSSMLADMKKTSAWKHVLLLHDAQYVFLALEGGEIEKYQTVLRSLPRARVPFSIIPPWQGLPSSSLSTHHFMMQDVMILHDTNRLKLPLPRLLKRVFDIIVSGTALLFLFPVFVAVALMVRRDGGDAFFKQARVGRGGHLFMCYKFRSMRADAEEFLEKYLAENKVAAEEWQKYQKLKDDVRVTAIGRFIRSTSIDELPQLINVLKGDMSLVGPRPCMPGQESLYAEDFSFYEAVRPGITGPWQVSGRSNLTFKERVSLEAWYARNWSLWLDIVIMLKTVPTLLKQGQAF